MINFHFEGSINFPLNKTITKKYIKELVEEEGKETGNLSIIFCADEYLHDINRRFLNHDYYTDIVTFDYCERDIISGDIFISIDRVNENAQNFHCSVKEELHRVMFHGILHMIGYNDKTEEEKVRMREKEDYYLTCLLGQDVN
jgi:probable rRNA maturation factor